MFSISFGDPANPRQHLSLWETVVGGGIEHLIKVCCSHTYSASVLVPVYRIEANFRCANLLVLDFDEGTSIEEVSEKVNGLHHAICPTRSHGLDKGDGKGPQDRFRLMLELDRTIWDLDTYKHTARKWAERLGADKLATGGAQAWRISREVAIYERGDKAKAHLDVPIQAGLERQRREMDRAKSLRSAPRITRALHRVMSDTIPEGQGNSTIYRAACDAFDLGWDFFRVVSTFEQHLPWFREAGGADTVRSAARKKLVPH